MNRRRLVLLLAVVLVLGATIGAAARLLGRSSPPASSAPPIMTWPSGARAAPAFTLRDQNGRSVSITDLLGRDALITFIDPLCRNFCPLEARVLGEAAASLPLGERPSIVAVSVNRWGDARANLVADEQKWRVGSDWKWAIGSPRALASVWRRYGIGVQDVPRTLAGVTVHEITHTEAAYLIDRSGHERALFVWPFTARTVENTVTSLAGS